MEINSLKSLLDYKIEDIDDHVMKSALELFINVKEHECKYGIMHMLTGVLMSNGSNGGSNGSSIGSIGSIGSSGSSGGEKYSSETMLKYYECCKIYLKNTCHLLRRSPIHEWDKFAIENGNYILYNAKLYISFSHERDKLDERMYTTIFMIMTNLAFKDIIDDFFVNHALKWYYKTENEMLRLNIVYFLQNVYLDDDWIDNDEFTEQYTECMKHFINKYYILYPLLSMELLIDGRVLFPLSKHWVDLILSLMEQNVEHYEIFEKCVVYLNYINDTDLIEYILQRTAVKMIVNKAINTEDEAILYLLTNMFVTFTSCVDTEMPCEFYYKYIFHKMMVQEKLIKVYPKHVLFGLSNIVSETVNTLFINVNDVLSYVSNVIRYYDDCEELCVDIYYIIDNLRNVLSSFKEIISHANFIDAYARWMYMGDIKIYRLTRIMFHYIAYNPEYHYLYKSILSERVMELSRDSYMYKRIVNRYMNFTLEQKCAKLLYKMGKIDVEDLEALDITIY